MSKQNITFEKNYNINMLTMFKKNIRIIKVKTLYKVREISLLL